MDHRQNKITIRTITRRGETCWEMCLFYDKDREIDCMMRTSPDWVGQVHCRRRRVNFHLCFSPLWFSSCSLKLQLIRRLLLRQNPTVRWIDIVISHMYPAEVQSRRKKEVKKRRVDSQHHTISPRVILCADHGVRSSTPLGQRGR